MAMPGLSERVAKAIKELDIDFSRLNFAGWFVSLTSLGLGFFTAAAAYWSVLGRMPHDKGPALVFGLTMLGTTVVLFVTLRAVLATFQVPIVKDFWRDDSDGLDRRDL
jgi:hypothetical protein